MEHPTRGRARLFVTAPARPRVTVAPRAVARGRVLLEGVPVEAAVVSVLPAFEAIAGARNPISLFSESTRTGRDGRFETALPDEGHVSLTVSYEGAAARLALGDVGDLPPVIALGDIRLEAPIEVEVMVALEPGCVRSCWRFVAKSALSETPAILLTMRLRPFNDAPPPVEARRRRDCRGTLHADGVFR